MGVFDKNKKSNQLYPLTHNETDVEQYLEIWD